MSESYSHESVLVRELVEVFGVLDDGLFVDGTVGGGGFAAALLGGAGEGLKLLGLDVDPDAIQAAATRLRPFGGRVTLARRNYTQIGEELRVVGCDRAAGIVLDLGISSNLLDGERGFSFRISGPLDMRMDPDRNVTAGQVIADASDGELAELLRRFGEVPGAGKVARGIKRAQENGRMETTMDLAHVVRSVLPRMGTRAVATVFQAFRIVVNGELDNLSEFLAVAPGLLRVGGRLGLISFHSLEDRMVKHTFRKLAAGDEYVLGVKKPITPAKEEVDHNSRARSAKFRWIERVG